MAPLRRRCAFLSAGAATALLACAAPPPRLDRVEPPRGFVDRRQSVILHGSGLEAGAEERGADVVAVPWSGTVGGRKILLLRPIDGERLEAVFPAGLPPGEHDVVVRLGAFEARLFGGYGVTLPVAPRIEGAEPDRVELAGARVQLSGVGFHLGAEVQVGGVPIERVVWIDDRTLDLFFVPPGPGPLDVEVETPVGRALRKGLVHAVDAP